MSKVQVSDLAKSINKTSKEVVVFLREQGFDVRNHLSTIDENQERLVREKFAPETLVKKQPAAKKPVPQKKPVEKAGKKPIPQTFDGRPKEVRERAEREAAERAAKAGFSTAMSDALNEVRSQIRKPSEQKVARTTVKPEAVETEITTAVPETVKVVPEAPEVKEQAPVAEAPVKAPETAPAAPAETAVPQEKAAPEKAEKTPEEKPVDKAAEKPAEKAPEKVMTPEEAARAYAQKKARQAAASAAKNSANQNAQGGRNTNRTARGENRDRTQGSRNGRPGQGQDGRDRTGQEGRQDARQDGRRPANGNTGAGNRNRQGTTVQGQGPARNQGAAKDGRGGNAAGRGSFGNDRRQSAAPAADTRISTKSTGGRDREKERERERLKERERQEKNLGKKFDRNKAMSTLGDDDNVSYRKKKDPNRKGAFIKPEAPVKVEEDPDAIKTLILPDSITIKDLADKMKIQPAQIVKKLLLEGKMYSINQEIPFEEAEEIAMEYEYICEHEEKVDLVAELLKEDEEDEALMEKRPPVVCVMGHVDHGKTSLLDAIRETNVTSREAGGITQRIGASVVEIDGRKITFLDTPGHEAFTAMRMRGAQSTDIAILVVAADDGVMPQTVEAINHAKAAGVEIIVAINKIDKEAANIERVKQELTNYDLVPEEWGGSTIFVPVSARTGEGIDTLLEMVLLTADVNEYKANPNRSARGIVIEASLDKGRGPVATVLVQKGTLHVGDNISIGSTFGKVRAMLDDHGKNVKMATPSIPVEILGLNGVPNSGDTMLTFKEEREARAAADTFISQSKEKLIDETKAKLSLDSLFEEMNAGNVKDLNIIIKADVQGSVEAIRQSLLKLSNEEVAIRVIHGAAGTINESDVSLASASNAIIIGFNVKPDAVAKSTAEREKVDIRLYSVIYNIMSDIELAMKGMLEPVYEERVIGHAEIRQVFKASGVGNIAGSYITDGKVIRGCKARVYRKEELLFEGNLASLKRFKDDVKEVTAGYECGLVFEKFGDVTEFDRVEFYQMVEVPR